MTIEARVITDDVDRALEAINRWIATGSALDIAGDVSLEAARTAFETESDPVTGAPWERLAASTLLAQKRRRGILRVTESLANSFNKGRKGSIWRKTAAMLEVGSSDDNATRHHYGGTRAYPIRARGGKMLRFMGVLEGGGIGWIFRKQVMHPPLPARPMLGVGPSQTPEIERRMLIALEGFIAAGRSGLVGS